MAVLFRYTVNEDALTYKTFVLVKQMMFDTELVRLYRA